MTKSIFLITLREKLAGLPKEDVDERISFYEEMINDRMDEGKSEEEAVADIGSVDEVIYEIAQDTPLVKLVKEKIKPKRKLKTWEIILLIVCFPIWFPLAITALILCLVAYLLIWIFVIVAYALELALSVSSVTSLIVFFILLFTGEPNIAYLGLAIMCGGGAVLLVFGCYYITKWTIRLSKFIVTKIKTLFIKKGDKK